MIRGIQTILSKLPKGSDVFVFGSRLHRFESNDVDVLVLYDPRECKPQAAYNTIAPVVTQLEAFFGNSIDLTLLTYEENESINFRQITSSVRLVDFYEEP